MARCRRWLVILSDGDDDPPFLYTQRCLKQLDRAVLVDPLDAGAHCRSSSYTLHRSRKAYLSGLYTIRRAGADALQKSRIRLPLAVEFLDRSHVTGRRTRPGE